MPVIVACPSCGGKLRVSDALLGQRVRCPACNHTFGTAAEPAPLLTPPTPQDLPLQLALDDPSASPPPAPATGTRGLIGAVELTSSQENDPPIASRAPAFPGPERLPSASPRRSPPRWTNEEDNDWEVPDLRRRLPRRDAEPDRGAVVLSLGIISLAGTVVYCAAPLWAILGLIAWIMGRIDLRKMKRGQMDEHGRGMTQAGWICGILGVVFNGLLMLACGSFAGFAWYLEMTRPPNTQPIPITRPPQAPPPNPGFPPPQPRPPVRQF